VGYEEVTEYACRLIEAARINPDPFAHLIIDGIFPEAYYEQILRHLPPPSALSIPVKFGMMRLVPDDPVLNGLSAEGRKFWSDFEGEVKTPICRALLKRYFRYAEEKLTLIFGDRARAWVGELKQDEFIPLRGIVQCRIAGDRMGAHVDKATSLFTYLFYFAPDDSLRPFGTIFYEAKDRAHVLERYRANSAIRAWFPAADELELTPLAPLEFRRNRLLSYVNLPYSLHGAATDAEAPRYSMQSFCDFPRRVTLPLFDGWKDSSSPTGIYRGDV
jgi:hypothetical protein